MDQLQPSIEEIGCWAEQAFAKKNMTKIFINTAIVLAMSALTQQALACASCGCSLNSDWGTQGVSNQEGFSLDVRYDSLNQNQLWSGTGKTNAQSAVGTQNPATGKFAEVEDFTKSQTITPVLDYNNGKDWGVSLSLPYVIRNHSTSGTSADGVSIGSNGDAYASQASGIGDVRVVGRYFGFSEQQNVGIQFGLKLPTGKTNQLASDGATQVDPGLQLGTGSTDLILGAYFHDNINQNWGYFSQVMYQTAIKNGMAFGLSYRPGNSVNINGGLRYEGFDVIKPTLQINTRFVQKDSGDAADTFSTGGTLVYVTPGFIVPIDETLSVYSNLQIPMYQNVNGIQLTPRYIFSLGAHLNF